MTDLRQTAQQALEALCSAVEPKKGKVYARGFEPIDCYAMHEQAITALREALEQPEQEPTCPECKAVVLYECVACSSNNYPPKPEQEPCVGKDPRCPCNDGDACHYKDCGGTKALPVPVAQPAQEPVATLFGTLPVYDTPPAAQRPWQGLTDEEIESAISDGFARGLDDGNVSNRAVIKYVRGIEAKLKEHNT